MCGGVKSGIFHTGGIQYLGVFCIWDFRIKDAQSVGHVLIATVQYQNSPNLDLSFTQP